jgi:hypothetical protein
MTEPTTRYGDSRGRFPIIEEGTPLTAAQIALLKEAFSRRRKSPTRDASAAGDPTTKTQFGCDDLLCICDGVDDCNDMFEGDDCGPTAMCFGDGAGGTWCVCLQ